MNKWITFLKFVRIGKLKISDIIIMNQKTLSRKLVEFIVLQKKKLRLGIRRKKKRSLT
jgi:hypothetical protein